MKITFVSSFHFRGIVKILNKEYVLGGKLLSMDRYKLFLKGRTTVGYSSSFFTWSMINHFSKRRYEQNVIYVTVYHSLNPVTVTVQRHIPNPFVYSHDNSSSKFLNWILVFLVSFRWNIPLCWHKKNGTNRPSITAIICYYRVHSLYVCNDWFWKTDWRI